MPGHAKSNSKKCQNACKYHDQLMEKGGTAYKELAELPGTFWKDLKFDGRRVMHPSIEDTTVLVNKRNAAHMIPSLILMSAYWGFHGEPDKLFFVPANARGRKAHYVSRRQVIEARVVATKMSVPLFLRDIEIQGQLRDVQKKTRSEINTALTATFEPENDDLLNLPFGTFLIALHRCSYKGRMKIMNVKLWVNVWLHLSGKRTRSIREVLELIVTKI
ncbi:hypothetical protein EDD18DRAFT_1107425 [Armillaria luteobubalina]|uniref:Uncharacterized protein n=1 Tax=Armillaria luteobubalina TaxID=153913 RepID=A0AA39UL69_9AGAR|nr:hypothetical protein EDD18DRAFT_1107425 [Armillaria luteobubalina]